MFSLEKEVKKWYNSCKTRINPRCMVLNTQQLESFIQVAENLNFARAAEILNVTQSAVSRQIQGLEEELNTKLFYRTTRTVLLTPEGNIFLEHAKQMLEHLRIASARMQHHSSVGTQVLRIGCESEGELRFLRELLRTCRNTIEAFHPYLRILPHQALLNLFFQGELEVLFGFEDGLPVREGLHFTPLRQVPLCCVVPNGHPLTQRTHIDEETLFAQELVLCNAYTIPTQATALQNRIAQHLSPERIHISENAQVVRMLVQAGYGCAILPQPAAGDPELTYLPLDGIAPLRYGICCAKTVGDALLKQFVQLAQQVARQLDDADCPRP